MLVGEQRFCAQRDSCVDVIASEVSSRGCFARGPYPLSFSPIYRSQPWLCALMLTRRYHFGLACCSRLWRWHPGPPRSAKRLYQLAVKIHFPVLWPQVHNVEIRPLAGPWDRHVLQARISNLLQGRSPWKELTYSRADE